MTSCRGLPLCRPLLQRFHRLGYESPQKICAGHRQYWRRRDIFSDISCAMQNLEKDMQQMNREMNRCFDNARSGSPFGISNWFQPFSGKTRDVPIIENNKDGRVYRLEVNMPSLKPEEISITLQDHVLTIQGKKEEKKNDSNFVHNYCYQYTLPDEVDPDTIRSLFDKGVLTIEAPLPAKEESKPQEIPILKKNAPVQDSGDK